MTKENVIAIREALKGEKKCPVKLICDNMILIDEANEVVIWDDDNGVVKVIRPNPNAIDKKGANIQIIETEYDLIQYIHISANIDVLRDYTKDLVNKGLATQEQANGILRWANNFSVDPQPIEESISSNNKSTEQDGSGDSMVEE